MCVEKSNCEKINVKLLSCDAVLPQKADDGAAGYDLYAPKDFVLKEGRQVVPIDISIEIPYGWEGHIRPRSGFSSKGMEVMPINDGISKYEPRRINADVIQGTIDSSYRGNIGVIVNNHACGAYVIPKGTRIAQIVFEKCFCGELVEVDELSCTSRGNGGFGHSGNK